VSITRSRPSEKTSTPELKSASHHDPGRRERTIDRRVEQRFKKLYQQILSSASCSPLALLNSALARSPHGTAAGVAAVAACGS